MSRRCLGGERKVDVGASYARRVAESADEVSYELRSSFDGPLAGVATVPKRAPGEFVVEGGADAWPLARQVMGKLLRHVRETGEWPSAISHVAG